MGKYTQGTVAIAICDRCGFQYPFQSLIKQWNGFKNCTHCWEMKHPQLDPIYPPTEPQAIFEPRPSRIEPMDVPVGQNIFPFIGNTSLQGVMMIGIVSVEIT